jgi:hypothetical protein
MPSPLPVFAKAEVQPRPGIGAVHSVIVLLRYLSAIRSSAERKRLAAHYTEHVQNQLSAPERDLSQRIIQEIEKAERSSIPALKPARADYWIRELAREAGELFRSEVSVDPKLGRRLLSELRDNWS